MVGAKCLVPFTSVVITVVDFNVVGNQFLYHPI